MLAQEIEAAAKRCMEKEFFSDGMSQFPMEQDQWETAWPKIVGTYLRFYAADQRPFAIYPGNAAHAVEDICPQADFWVIILGSNVYKSICFDPGRDSYPAVKWIYVDIMDIRHLKDDEALQAVACFISSRIKDRMLEEKGRETK